MKILREQHWRYSEDQVQFRNTIAIDLARSEDELLAAMSQSTRRKVRIAQREGVDHQRRRHDLRPAPQRCGLDGHRASGEPYARRRRLVRRPRPLSGTELSSRVSEPARTIRSQIDCS